MVPDLRLLRYFLAVAEDLHFRKAAERLFISQPALSRQIKHLEEQLDAELFVRTGSAIRLTDAGRVLAEHAGRALREAEAGVNAVRRARLGELGRVRVSYVMGAANSVLPDIVAKYRARYPDVTLELQELRHDLEIADLAQCDIALTRPFEAEGDIVLETLVDEPYAVFLTEGHRYAALAEVDLSMLAQESFIMAPRQERPRSFDFAISACFKSGFTPSIVQEAATVGSMLGLVAAGVGVCLLPSSNHVLNRAGVRCVPIKDLRIGMVMAWDPTALSAAATNFIKIARRFAAH